MANSAHFPREGEYEKEKLHQIKYYTDPCNNKKWVGQAEQSTKTQGAGISSHGDRPAGIKDF